MTKRALKKMAMREAAAWLTADADSNDLDPDLTEEEADAVRDEIRQIALRLELKGQS